MSSIKWIKGLLSYKVSFGFLARLAGYSAAAAMILGCFGSVSWLLDLFSHFQMQYFPILLFASAYLAFKKCRIEALVMTLFLTANFAGIAGFYFSRDRSPENGTPVRIMLSNVYTANSSYDLLRNLVTEEDPDIIVLEEISREWLDNIGALKEKYPYKILCPQEDNFGIGIFSKLPLTSEKVSYWGDYRLPYIEAKVEHCGKHFDIIAVHTVPPMRKDGWLMRNEQILDFAVIAKSKSSPTVLIGDLNVTPWSPVFRKLKRDSGLQDSMKGFGVQASWPVQIFPLRIPLDHCLVSKEIFVKNRKLGGDLGSDHYPVIIDLLTSQK